FARTGLHDRCHLPKNAAACLRSPLLPPVRARPATKPEPMGSATTAGCAVDGGKAFIFGAHSCSFLRLRNETARPRTTFHSSWLVGRLHGRVGRRSRKARRSVGQERRPAVHRPCRSRTVDPASRA